MIIAKGLREAVMKCFRSLEPQLCVTHNFGYPVAPETRERSMRRFCNRMQSQVHGRNWNRRDTDEPMVAVGVWEHLDSNPHWHVLISGSDEESAWLLEEGNKSCWLWLQPRGQFDVSEIQAPRKVISYITKEIYKPDSQDQLFIYQAPPSKPANSNLGEPTSGRIDSSLSEATLRVFSSNNPAGPNSIGLATGTAHLAREKEIAKAWGDQNVRFAKRAIKSNRV